MILNSAGQFSFFTPRSPFLYLIYHPHVRTYHSEPRVYTVVSESETKELRFYPKADHLGSLVHCASSVARAVVFALPVESPNRAGILTRSRASNPTAFLISHLKAERLTRHVTSKGYHWFRFLSWDSGRAGACLVSSFKH